MTLKAGRLVSALICAFMLFSLFTVVPSAEESELWAYINGENITRTADTAIIYKGVATTGQTQWGHDIVIDADGVVTDIIEGGLPEGENLAVPDGGAVVSVAGTRVAWFKANIKVGTKVYYDGYTQKLFICDSNGRFNPYFTKSLTVTGEGNYCIANVLIEGVPVYSYDIAVDAKGIVVARGSNIQVPEGGFTVSAGTDEDMQKLIAYAPLGAKCVIADGNATFTYDEKCLKQTATLELARYEEAITAAIGNFACSEPQAALDTVSAAKITLSSVKDYKLLADTLCSLKEKITGYCTEEFGYELRGAYHVPAETDINDVRETVRNAANAGLNTIILRATNGYGTFIPQPEGSIFGQDSSLGGFDVLKAYIQVCEEENIALALCVDVYYNEYASVAKPSWMTEPNGSERGLCDKYFSPANQEFKEYYLGYIKSIVSNYEIDTIVFDYLRYPKFSEACDLGYDYETLNAFAEQYGVPIGEANDIKNQLFNSPHWQKWVEFRTGLVSDMAQAISDTVRSVRTDITMIASAGRDTVAHYYMQDAVSWVENGCFDGLCVALYEGDADENDKIDAFDYRDGFVYEKSSLFSAYMGNSAYFIAALDAGNSITGEVMAGAISECRKLKSDGFIFSDLNKFLAQNYHLSLAENALKNDAASPFDETNSAMKQLLEISKAKINGCILSMGGCNEATVAQALSKINDALLLLNDGVLDYESAYALESDIAILFAASPAKQVVMREYAAITKLALLHKTNTVETPPETDVDQSESEVSEGNGESNISVGDEVSEESVEESQAEQSAGKKIEIGNVLIYTFVGLTLITAMVAIIIAIKRKSERPANHHMPRASKRNNENGDE